MIEPDDLKVLELGARRKRAAVSPGPVRDPARLRRRDRRRAHEDGPPDQLHPRSPVDRQRWARVGEPERKLAEQLTTDRLVADRARRGGGVGFGQHRLAAMRGGGGGDLTRAPDRQAAARCDRPARSPSDRAAARDLRAIGIGRGTHRRSAADRHAAARRGRARRGHAGVVDAGDDQERQPCHQPDRARQALLARRRACTSPKGAPRSGRLPDHVVVSPHARAAPGRRSGRVLAAPQRPGPNVATRRPRRWSSLRSRIVTSWWNAVLGLGRTSYEQRLPDLIWDRPASDRWALLSALFEGDGSWSLVNGGPSVVIELGTVSDELADGVMRLLASVGIVASSKTWPDREVHQGHATGSGSPAPTRSSGRSSSSQSATAPASWLRSRASASGSRPPGTGGSTTGPAWARVASTEQRAFTGPVYSLEVPYAHTFVGSRCSSL